MLLQSLVVAALVLGSAAYAAWALMPRDLKRSLAVAMGRLPLPAVAAAFFRRHSVVSTGCGCDGCDAGSKPRAVAASAAATPTTATITFHPRRKA